MATVQGFYVSREVFYAGIQALLDNAQASFTRRTFAAIAIQRMVRGFLIRKYVAMLNQAAITIQCCYRKHVARKMYRIALHQTVQLIHTRYYNKKITIIQALWRGFKSKRDNFDFYAYRLWLKYVTEEGQKRSCEAREFGIISRANNLSILEEEAKQWLAYVVFKLHHLLRTWCCAGIYSNIGSTELSEFEKLLAAIKYTEYMRRLKIKYEEFVRKNKPKFANKRLFPIIGNGSDYWYLTLPEMYELTLENWDPVSTRHLPFSHGPQHARPFLWQKLTPIHNEQRGPFKVQKRLKKMPVTPCPTADISMVTASQRKDPRFNLYVNCYKPRPEIFEYVNYNVNIILRRKCSIINM